MVKTRAQRGKGLATPSPKRASRGESNANGNGIKSPDTVAKSKTTRKTRGGTESEENGLSEEKRLLARTPRGRLSRGKPESEKKPTKTHLLDQGSPTKRQSRRNAEAIQTDTHKDARCNARTDSNMLEGENENDEEEEDEDNDHEECDNDDDSEDDLKEKRTFRVEKKTKQASGLFTNEEDNEEEEEDEEEEEGADEEEEDEGEEEDGEGDEEESVGAAGLDVDEEDEEEEDEDVEEDEEKENDSDAPEDVSFSKSRHEALESISQALQQSKRSEEQAKEKRRNRDKLLKLQKEKKKISLRHARLPDDFLSEIAELPNQEQETVGAPKPEARAGHHIKFESEGEEEDNFDDFEGGEDYIPFSSDEPRVVEGFAVHAISRQQRAPPPKSESALDFLQKQLYGSKVKRESVNKHQSRMLKRRGQPAMVFLNPKEKKRKTRLSDGSRVK